MPSYYDEEGNYVWVDPLPTELELKAQEYAKQIQSLVEDPQPRPPEECMHAHMQMLDLMFRGLVTSGLNGDALGHYPLALKTQAAYRRTWMSLNYIRLQQNAMENIPHLTPPTSDTKK